MGAAQHVYSVRVLLALSYVFSPGRSFKITCARWGVHVVSQCKQALVDWMYTIGAYEDSDESGLVPRACVLFCVRVWIDSLVMMHATILVCCVPVLLPVQQPHLFR